MIKKFIYNFINKIVSKGRKHWQLIVFGLIIGLILSNLFSNKPPKGEGAHAGHQMKSSQQEKKIRYWTCSMHPQIKLPKPGQCPICAMDLIPVYESGTESSEAEPVSLILNETGRKLAEVETAKVELRQATNQVRLVGKVDYDETRLSYISAWIPGRIDRLFVDFTGTKVRKGDHLIKLYSPELLATQEEYLQAIKNLDESKDTQLSVIRDTARTTLTSVKEKLRLYGISSKQIDEIAKRGKPDEHMIITSPVTGTVIHKNGFKGMYVKTGDKIYTIADLSRVWLYLDAYESDIQWLHYGQKVIVEAESFPGEMFEGKIAFIDPFVNEKTRTIKLRVNVENKNEKLKPGMFVRTTVNAVLGEDGKVYEESLAGKWICPMHPDIVKDNQEPCDICGMDLIKTSEFGFADKPVLQKRVLVIPKTAPLITGKRAVVYVEQTTDNENLRRYVGREVVLGPLAGDFYIVYSGLSQGEEVVVKGNFKIDSALQIQAKPSMMNPAGFYSEADGIFSKSSGASLDNAGILKESLPYYLAVGAALSEDSSDQAAKNLGKFKEEIDKLFSVSLLGKQDGIALQISALQGSMSIIEDDLVSLRNQFSDVSLILKDIFQKYEYREDLKLFLNFCPMFSDNKGGYWLSDSQEIKNPYFGEKMLSCGETKAEYGRKIKESKPMTGHEGHQM